MSEAGWGIWAGLPPSARRQLVQEEAREALESRRAAQERQVKAEQWRDANLTLARAQAEARGEEISVLAQARGEIAGRPIAAIFADAQRAGDAQDARDAAQLRREGNSGRVHVEFVDDPVIHHARNETGRRMTNRYRRWKDAIDKRQAAEEAEARTAYDIPLERPITLKPRPDPAVDGRLVRRSEDVPPRHVSFR